MYDKRSDWGIKTKQIIYFAFLFYILIDMINGLILMSGSRSFISSAFKMAILVFSIMSLKFAITELAVNLTFVLICAFSLFFTHAEFGSEVSLYTKMFKIVYCIVLCKYIAEFYKGDDYKSSYNIIKYNTFYFVVNCFIGILGLGFHTYVRGSGLKGFFYAGNELSLTFFCLYSIYIFRISKKILQLLFTIGAIVIAVLIGTKTAILSIVIMFIFVISYKKRIKYYRVVIVAVCIGILLMCFKDKILNISTIQFQVDKFQWQLNKYGSLPNTIMSGRLTFLESYIERYREGNVLLNTIFGIGVVNNKIIESDFLDLFFNYGIIVTGFIFVFYIKIIIRSFKNKKLFLFNSLYFLIANLVGHTLTNTTAVLFFAIINLEQVQSRIFNVERNNDGYSFDYR